MNIAPALGDHQFPNVPADVRLHVFLEHHIVRVRAGDAANFRVHHLLATLGGKCFRAGDIGGNRGASSEVVMERQHIHGVGQRLHVALVGDADRDGSFFVQLVQCGGDKPGNFQSLLLTIASTARIIIRFIRGIPECQGGFLADRGDQFRHKITNLILLDRAVFADKGLRVADGDHHADRVAMARADKVDQVTPKGSFIGLQSGIIHEHAQLVKFQSIGVVQITFGLGRIVVKPIIGRVRGSRSAVVGASDRG